MTRYIFKHDNEITAEKSYDWSTHCLILNKSRSVICKVPIKDIEESLSWELVPETQFELKKKNMTELKNKRVYKVDRTHKTWIKSEVKFLNDNRLKYQLKDLAYRLNRTEYSIIRQLSRIKKEGFDSIYNSTRESLPTPKLKKNLIKSKVNNNRTVKVLWGLFSFNY